MNGDTRRTEFTVTLTGEQWDAIAWGEDRRYADSGGARSAAMERIIQATPGARERRDAAHRDAIERIPHLTADGRSQLEASMRSALEAFRAGKLDVDHLGLGTYPERMSADGYRVTVVPHLHRPHDEPTPRSGFHLSQAHPVWFEKSEMAMDGADRGWFIATVGNLTGCAGEPWGGGPWVSVPFTTPAAALRG